MSEQHPFVQIEEALKKEFIEKAVKWLEENASKYINQYTQDDYSFDMQSFIGNFKKAM